MLRRVFSDLFGEADHGRYAIGLAATPAYSGGLWAWPTPSGSVP
jgi:hypothetical protein